MSKSYTNTTLKQREAGEYGVGARLVADMRKRIVRGELTAGTLMPTRRAMARAWDVNLLTAQRVTDELMRDGFLRTDGRRGTFVADRLPHLTNYALVYPAAGTQSRFWMALRHGAEAVAHEREARIVTYLSALHRPDAPENQRLSDDMAAHRVAGAILVWPHKEFGAIMSDLRQSGGPCVIVDSRKSPEPGFLAVGLRTERFHDQAVARLTAHGRRRIAHIGLAAFHNPGEDAFAAVMSRRGLRLDPRWNIRIGPDYPPAANAVAHLLMSLQGDHRPDGLLVSDDNIVEHALAGLIAAGARVPDDIEVVTYCNYPDAVPSVLPVHRMGLDCTAIMRTAMNLIDKERREEKPQALTPMYPIFEEDLPRAEAVGAQG